MDPQPVQQPANGNSDAEELPARTKARSDSISQQSENSQTAADFIRDQMQLEAEAREALPYSIENCTKPLGSLRQSVFACLTCNPPPANPSDPYNAAGVCYACSVQCHGEHTLVEIFNKRNFTCDCGTTRFPSTSPCALRINPATNTKGGVHSEEPDADNKYNQNFRNRFCGCECDYDPFQQKGTMFQCLGLGTPETGGCGEDWYHPGCIVGLGPKWFENVQPAEKSEVKDADANGALPTIAEDAEQAPPQADGEPKPEPAEEEDDDVPPPPGFPADEEFEGFICYKCVDAYPWIKRYAGTSGFLLAVFLKQDDIATDLPTVITTDTEPTSKKRKASDEDDDMASQTSKRPKSEADFAQSPPSEAPIKDEDTKPPTTTTLCKLSNFPPAPEAPFSLFFRDSFRDQLCRCPTCFPLLTPHPQLLEEEETYEPPVSDDGASEHGSTHGSGSLLERGESALRNVDRVRAIEGVMAYNHLKDKLKPFFQQFAESGQAISAEDIKEYFAKLRGDDQAIKEAGEAAGRDDFREEQSGY
ncbi:putative zinc finger in N-recognin-domain-containing protein [Cercophora newfieldiana]|uniref:Zinc finger in N-recognin-domain-containing protein n=1 Tax=Cercophora newfieldiana TaxID=92897 RepID=A0AA40CXK6_9PEZI|nr:putative zinc finger in N-recognin-domain-containing protein [Cercophora newfieldiana]